MFYLHIQRIFIMRIAATCLAIASLLTVASAAEKKLQMKDLPPAVQKAVQDQTKGAEIKGISSETEKGKVSYEVETIASGKHRDISFDAKGALTSVEEETSLDAIPAAAKAAIQKKTAGGKISMIETVTQGSAVSYEAAYTDKGGKKHEYSVNAAGAEVKD
jgi:uncharacterized membrane protein YkoI